MSGAPINPTAAGVLVGIVAGVGLLGPPLIARVKFLKGAPLPEITLVLVVAWAGALRLLPLSLSTLHPWVVVAEQPTWLPLALWFVLASLGTRQAVVGSSRARLAAAFVGGIALGGIPTAAAMVAGASSPAEAAALALVASAAGAMSPFGSTATLCLPVSHAGYTAWAAIPALLCVAVAAAMAPGSTSADPTSALPRTALAALPGVAVALISPVIGLAVGALLAVAVALREPRKAVPVDVITTPTAAPRWFLVTALTLATAQLAATTWFAGRGLTWTAHRVLGPLAFTAGGLALGSVTEPAFIGAATGRAAHIAIGMTAHGPFAMALGLGLAPGIPLFLAALRHGRPALRTGVPIALAQMAIALLWALLVH